MAYLYFYARRWAPQVGHGWLALLLALLPLLARATNPVLTITGTGSTSTDVTAFVDQVQIIRVSDGAVLTAAVANASFETPAQGSGGYSYNPTGAGWTFGSNAGVARPGGGFNPPSPVPDGSQVAFVQTNGNGTGTLTQTLTLGVGTYQVRFQAGQRSLNSANQGLTVAIDGVVVLSTGAVPNNSAYTPYTSDAFTVAASLPPTLTAISPASGLVGGLLTLTGTNLTGTTAITFSGASNNVATVGFTVNAAGTQIMGIVVPSGATTGPLTVTTPGGTSNSVSFTVLGCPSGSRLYVNGANATPGLGGSWATAFTSLGEAVWTARQCGNITEIWVAQGTYLPTRTPDGTASAAGRDNTFYLPNGLKVYGGFAGTETALSGRTAGHATILSGDFNGDDVVSGSGSTLSFANNGENAYHVVLTVSATAATLLDGLSIRGGCATGNSSLSVASKSISQFDGAGLFNYSSSPTLTNCILAGNFTYSSGGGMRNNYSSSPTLTNCTLSGNAASSGGGLYNFSSSSPTLTNCTLSGNSASSNGGGLYNDHSSPTLTNCTLSGNAASYSYGGGLCNTSSSPTLTNCTFSGNSAGGSGGGLANLSSSPTLTNCTLSGNAANQDGGGLYYSSDAGGTVQNCILYNNTGGPTNQQNIYKDGTSTALTVRYSIVGDYLATATNNYTATNVSTADPRFVNASDPDGADNIFGTADDGLALQAASPAINAGDPARTSPVYDITGYLRTGVFDQGAYEYESITTLTRLYVNGANATPGLGGSWATALTSLGEAVWTARQYGNITEIWVAQGTYLPTRTPDGTASAAGRDNTFYLPNGLKVYGGFAGTETALSGRTAGHATILSGDFNGDDVVSGSGSTLSFANNGENAYHVVLTVSATAATLLDGLSIRGGNANANPNNGSTNLSVAGKTIYRYVGGGLLNASSSPTLTNCTLAGNAALAGGGLLNDDSSPTLTNCTLTGNAAGSGGGVFNDYSSPTLTNCTLTGNGAGSGGGLYYGGDAGGTVQNCILYNNAGGPANRQNIYKDGTSTALTVRYSTVGDYLATATNNYTVTNVSTADPQFVNASDPDGADNLIGTADDGLGLQAASPAINAGDPALTSPTTDLTGATRVGILDQGAYEFTQPVLLSVAPTQGGVGTRLTLAGVNLQGATQVTFSGSSSNVVTAGFTANATGSQLTGVVVPSGAQTGPLTVTTPLGTTNGVPFTVCRITATAQNASQPLSAANTATFQASDFVSGTPTSNCGGVTVTALKAVANGSLSASASEGQTLTLPAPPAGAVFTGVAFASYGNPGGSSGAYTIGTCHAASSQRVVEGFVLGQSGAVSIPVSNNTFGGDPCSGKAKTLAVTATYTFGTPAASLTYTCAEQGNNTVLLTLSDGNGATTTATATATVSVPTLATTTWTGAASPAWTDCANWSYGRLPDAGTSASLPAGLAQYPSLPAGTFDVNGLSIASGASLTLAAGSVLQVRGDLTYSPATALAGEVRLLGTAAQTLNSTGSLGLVTVAKTGGTLTLGHDLRVQTGLAFTATASTALTTTASYRVVLDASATLSETAAAAVVGTVEATRNVSTAGSSEGFGGIGTTLLPAASSPVLPGSTLVQRVTGTPATGLNGTTGIGRYYTITPTTDAGLNVTLTLAYRDAELGSIAENRLQLFRSEVGASGPWAAVAGASYDATANTVTKAGLSSFSTWTLGNLEGPLPVTLTDFTATAQGLSAVRLAWATASERNSARFEVERSLDGVAFANIGAVAAAGTTATAQRYGLLDAALPTGARVLYYRLRQVDLDGTFTYSPVRVVALSAQAGLALFPNPAPGHQATLSGATPSQAVQVLDAVGRVVLTATADAAGTAPLALPAGLPAGVYVVRAGAQSLRLTVE